MFPDQLAYIINHAGDRWLFVDPLFIPLVEKLMPALRGIEGIFVLTDDAHMPATTLAAGAELRVAHRGEGDDATHGPTSMNEPRRALCYTSGTTGDPKGVLYDHRSTLLHAYAGVAPDVLGLSARDTVLPVVPLFHVNAWAFRIRAQSPAPSWCCRGRR